MLNLRPGVRVLTMATLVLTVTADDRPGLVSDLAALVEAHDGNWLESQMARLAGTFAGIVCVDVPDQRVDSLQGALDGLPGVQVTVTPSESGTDAEQATWHVHLIGHDQPGIVAQLSQTLAAQGLTIEEFATSTVETPMAGGLLFRAAARVRAVGDTEPDDLRAALEALAGEFMVDIDLESAESSPV